MTTRSLSIALISLLAAFTAAGQEEKKSNIHIGFIYPISSNGAEAKEYTNVFSAHAIAGVSKSEEAFCAAGISNIVMEDANGVVAAGILNFVHDSVRGLQASGFLNYTSNHVEGVQTAGFLNMAGSVRGLQAAGFANITVTSVIGPQLAGFSNLADSAAMQGAGFLNIAEHTTGPQIAGFANIARQTSVQAAGFMNIAEQAKGIQVAGFANIAGDVPSQVAGFLNVAGKVKGIQVAGFMNIADSSDYPLGLVNIIGNGEKYLGFNVDESLNSLLSLRSGGRVLYGIVSGGYNLKTKDRLYVMEAGFGAHLNISKNFRFNIEASCTSISDVWEKVQLRPSVRVLPALKLGNYVELFAGPSLNVVAYDNGISADMEYNYLWQERNRGYHGIYIGATGGMHIRF